MKKRFTGILVLFVLVTLILSACAGKKDMATSTSGESYDMDVPAVSPDYPRTNAEESTYTSESKADNGSGSAVDYLKTGSYDVASTNTPVMTMEKIIRTISMELETKEFDDLITTVESEIARLEGYIESSSISGRRYNDSYSLRRGSIVARIPKDRFDEFIGIVNENANVVDQKENTKNVTLEYYDTESRKKALEIEQERLFDLLAKTDTVEEIIALESRLSSIRYELGQHETQLRIYDNQVEYSTVSMQIEEVERMTPVPVKKETVSERIRTGFSDTVYHLGEGFKNFFVWFVVNLPYLLIWVAIITVAAIIIRKYIIRQSRKSHTDAGPELGATKEEKK